MIHLLTPHPDFPCDAVSSIEVSASRPLADRMQTVYSVTGKMEVLNLPISEPTERRDELWQHTCFEAFVRAGPRGPYLEFNFAPSSHWAAYYFSGYRDGMRLAAGIEPPLFEMERRPDRFDMAVEFSLGAGTSLAECASLQLGLSAVIEETSGRKSYWALAHPAGKPDFHHNDCFTLELPVSEES